MRHVHLRRDLRRSIHDLLVVVLTNHATVVLQLWSLTPTDLRRKLSFTSQSSLVVLRDIDGLTMQVLKTVQHPWRNEILVDLINQRLHYER